MPKISVIIPIYNKEKFLKRSIESVLNQTYKDYELLLINDGSTDNSRTIAESYLNNQIILINQSNQGVSNARNTGIDVAKGEYIAFLDADDKWDTSYLEKMINGIKNSNVCYCGHNLVVNNKIHKSSIKFYEGDIFEKYILDKCGVHTNSWLIKKDYINKYNIRFLPGVNWGEDTIFFSQIMLYEKKVECVKEFLSYWHLDIENNLSSLSLEKIDKGLFAYNTIKHIINSNEDDVTRKRTLIKAFDAFRIPASIIYTLNSLSDKLNNNELRELLNTYENYTRNVKILYGLRSIKLMLFKRLLYKRSKNYRD